MSRRAVVTIAVLALLLLQVGLVVGGGWRETSTYDEAAHLRYGMQVLDGSTARFDDSKMPVSAVNAALARLAGQRDPDSLAAVRAARPGTLLAALLLSLLVFSWSRELYGAAAGVLSLALVVLDPNVVAHSTVVTTDVWSALTTAATFFLAWRYWKQPGAGRAAGLGAALGAAQLAKFMAIFLYALLPLVVGLQLLLRAGAEGVRSRPDRRRAAGRALAHGGLVLLTSLLVLNAGYLFQGTGTPLRAYAFRSEAFQSLQRRAGPAAEVPLPVPSAWLDGLDWGRASERTGAGYGNIYLLGERRHGRGFLGYFLVVSLFKVPLGTQAVLLAAGVALAARRRERLRLGNEIFLLVPLLFYLVYLNVFFRAQTGIRYLLPAFPLAYVLAGSLLRHGLGEASRRTKAVVGAGVLATAASVLAFFPHYIPYVNELLPRRIDAFRIFADSNIDWDQSGWYVDRYVAAHPGVILNPAEPVAGTIVARVNWLTGVHPIVYDTWLASHFAPIGHVAWAWLIFEVSPEEAERVRRELSAGAPGNSPG